MSGVGMADEVIEVWTCEDRWRVRAKARMQERKKGLDSAYIEPWNLERLRKRQTGWTRISSRWNVN